MQNITVIFLYIEKEFHSKLYNNTQRYCGLSSSVMQTIVCVYVYACVFVYSPHTTERNVLCLNCQEGIKKKSNTAVILSLINSSKSSRLTSLCVPAGVRVPSGPSDQPGPQLWQHHVLQDGRGGPLPLLWSAWAAALWLPGGRQQRHQDQPQRCVCPPRRRNVKYSFKGEKTRLAGGLYLASLSLSLCSGVKESSIDSLVFDTLIPKPIIQRYLNLLMEHRRIILSGPSGTGKSFLAVKLAEYIVSQMGQEVTEHNVASFNVDQNSSKVTAWSQEKGWHSTCFYLVIP